LGSKGFFYIWIYLRMKIGVIYEYCWVFVVGLRWTILIKIFGFNLKNHKFPL
jgi:hypothetical protein